MFTFLDMLARFGNAVTPYWAEIIGSFFIAIAGNLVATQGSQKESFRFFSLAFYMILVRDLMMVGLHLLPNTGFYINPEMATAVFQILTCLITALLFVGSFKNMNIFFTPMTLTIILTVLFAMGSLGLQQIPRYRLYGLYLAQLYQIMGLLTAGLSFYLARASRQNTAVRAVGMGFIIVTICYVYTILGLFKSTQEIILLGYSVAVILALAGQAQLLNVEIEIFKEKLEAEEKSKRDVWDISPFPIMISRLRDGVMLYMNPAACQMLTVSKLEVSGFKFFDYFADEKSKEDLLIQLQRVFIVKSFEVQVHHPNKNNLFWIDMTTRTTDWNEEVVLFTTFKDITDQKLTTEALREQAETDPLTKLYNRRQFEILSYQAIQNAIHRQTKYVILMFDIDLFKKVNDTYGHEAGDLVLTNVADVLRETLRKSDIIARYGGEEFIAFLPETSPKDAYVVAEHVRTAISKTKTTYKGTEISITLSVGISDCNTSNLEELIHQADQALYVSKENGRNWVTMYEDIPQTAGDTTPSIIVTEDAQSEYVVLKSDENNGGKEG